MNEVFETEPFSKTYSKLDNDEKEWVDSIKEQLKGSLGTGKPLVFYWFREKKRKNKRLYYIINESLKKALLIAYGTKKEQQETINGVLSNKEYYLRFIRS